MQMSQELYVHFLPLPVSEADVVSLDLGEKIVVEIICEYFLRKHPGLCELFQEAKFLTRSIKPKGSAKDYFIEKD